MDGEISQERLEYLLGRMEEAEREPATSLAEMYRRADPLQRLDLLRHLTALLRHRRAVV